MGRRAWLVGALIWASAGLQGVSAQTAATTAISPTLPYLDVVHEGRKVRIRRRTEASPGAGADQTGALRGCPPACLQPMQAAPGVETVGELELLEFVRSEVADGRGVLIDTRLAERYRMETLPTATNIPFSIVKMDNPHIARILQALGGRRTGSEWDFSAARDLLVFCGGPTSEEAPKSILMLLGMGFPAGKIRYYRGGMQSWRASGLTTVVPLAAP